MADDDLVSFSCVAFRLLEGGKGGAVIDNLGLNKAVKPLQIASAYLIGGDNIVYVFQGSSYEINIDFSQRDEYFLAIGCGIISANKNMI